MSKAISKFASFNDKKTLKQIAPKIIPNKYYSNNRHFIRSQRHYSEDEDYFHQNQQLYIHLQRENYWKDIDQPDNIFQQDIFDHYMNSQKPRKNLAQSSNNMQSK